MSDRFSLFLLLAALLLLPMPSGAQSPDDGRFDSYARLLSPEKVYIHTDREVYNIGDTIWFRGYLENVAPQAEYAPCNYIYVELFSAQWERTLQQSRREKTRLQRFSAAHEPDARYLYQMDEPTATAADIASSMAYVFGIPAMVALGDGRLIVLEREVFVPSSTSEILAKTFATIKLYVVDPATDGAGILRKKLLTQFSTGIDSFFSASLANYEGMCLGPVVGGKQSLVLIADSQKGMKKTVPYIGEVTLTHEYVKVILLENL